MTPDPIAPEPTLRPHPTPWRARLYRIIFESDTPAGRAFDVALIAAILLSVAVVMLESVAGFRARFGPELRAAEWVFTIVFSIEYVLRLATVKRPVRYAWSFFGVVDFLSIVPTYLSQLVAGTQYLLVIRMLRILRVFRVLKLVEYLSSANVLMRALHASRYKITVFVFAVLTLVVILGSLMYMVEGAANGFTSIPRSVYWAIVTLTTVGYGDISPQTDLGQALAAVVMITGYAIIAVPTGIVTVELSRAGRELEGPRTPAPRPADLPTAATSGAAGRPAATDDACERCGAGGHEEDALFCRRCGTRLEPF